jgi:hypothetical protein
MFTQNRGETKRMKANEFDTPDRPNSLRIIYGPDKFVHRSDIVCSSMDV